MRVLVVEDEIKMASLIRRGLRSEGLAADVAIKGEDALWMAGSTTYDAIVLDVMLPGIDGFETCRRLREAGHLGARADAHGARRGRRPRGRPRRRRRRLPDQAVLVRRAAGAPARARPPRPRRAPRGARGRRPAPGPRRPPRLARRQTEVSLSAKEFQLLETFMRHPGEVLSRYQLLEHAWDYDYENRSNIVDVYVRYLRDKIDRPFGLSTLETVRGAGYRLDDRVPADSPPRSALSSATGRAASWTAARSGGPCAAAPPPTGRPGRR